MLSYKQWKSLNESILPSFNLGLGGPRKIGIQLQNGFDTEASEEIENNNEEEVQEEGKKQPNVKVKVKKEEGCGCGKMCGKMSKKKMEDEDLEDEDSEDEDSEDENSEDENSEDENSEDENSEDENSEDENSEDENSEDENSEDEDSEDEDSEDEIKFSKKSKKKMLKGNQHKLDANKNGKIDKEDFKLLKNKKKLKKEAAEQEWWDSIKKMTSSTDVYKKFNDGWSEYNADGLFRPIDPESLTQAVREEPNPGEVGFAPQGKLGQEEESLSEARWVYHKDGVALKAEKNEEPKKYKTLTHANSDAEKFGGRAVKHGSEYIIVKSKNVPDQEELKKKPSFHSGEYVMPARGDNAEAKKTLRSDIKASRIAKRSNTKKLSQ